MAKKETETEVKAEKPQRPLPVVTFAYPLHGAGKLTKRYVRVLEMDDKHIKGFQIESEFDEEPGSPHTYITDKVLDKYVRLLHIAPPEE